jgi:hypothetical protein
VTCSWSAAWPPAIASASASPISGNTAIIAPSNWVAAAVIGSSDSSRRTVAVAGAAVGGASAGTAATSILASANAGNGVIVAPMITARVARIRISASIGISTPPSSGITFPSASTHSKTASRSARSTLMPRSVPSATSRAASAPSTPVSNAPSPHTSFVASSR